MTSNKNSSGSTGSRAARGASLAVALAVVVSLLAVGCTPARLGGPRPVPIPAALLDRMDYGSPFAVNEPANVDDPYHVRASLGNDENPWATAGQGALMVGLFVAASALCSGGSCRLP